MKNVIFVIIINIGFVIAAYSQSGWICLNPLPAGQLNGVSTINDNTAFAVGTNGTLLKTTNGGNYWIRKTFGDSIYLDCISFTNSSTGWVANYEGKIYKTTDGGESLIRQISTTNHGLSSIFFISPQIGWCAGDSGIIIKTTNGGLNWITKYYCDSIWLNSIYFINENVGWAVGAYKVILKTTNGGDDWFSQSTNIPASVFFSVFLLSPDTCFITGVSYVGKDKFTALRRNENARIIDKNLWSSLVLKTTNGGINWNPLLNTPGSGIFSVYFLNNNIGLSMAGDEGKIFKTTDAGISWYQVYQIDRSLVSASYTGNIGWVVGNGIALKTTNVGNNWIVQLSTNINTFYSVFFISNETGWIAGNRNILKSTNSGLNWVSQLDNDSLTINSIYFIDQNTGWAGGIEYDYTNYIPHGKIYKTTNGGTNWVNTYTKDKFNLAKMYFASLSTGYAVGDSSYSSALIAKSTDGGLTWASIPGLNLSSTFLTSVYFVSPDIGWVCGHYYGNSYIYKTANGGNNWVQQFFNDISTINSLYFVNAQTGWAAFSWDQIKIYKTTNGGGNWFGQSTNNSPGLTSIYFISPSTGWACGYGGSVLRTTNGGNLWSKQYNGIRDDLKAVFFISPDIGWTVGSGGAILYTTNGGEPIGIKPIPSKIPKSFSLSQNFPNPFNPTTKIKFDIPKSGYVKIVIYDVLGRELTTLVNEQLKPCVYEVEWNASNMPSGVYFYKINAGDFSETKKMIFIK